MIHVEFLPERIIRQRRRVRSMIRQCCLMVVCVMALAVFAYLRQGQIQQARAECGDLSRQAEDAACRVDTRARYEAELAELLVQRSISEQIGNRASALDVLCELQTLIPDELTLTELRIETTLVSSRPDMASSSSRPVTGGGSMPPVHQTRLIIRGVAPSDIEVANFIGDLASNPLFEGIRMGYSRVGEHAGCNVRQFEVRLMVAR